jgi:hypothetical protein
MTRENGEKYPSKLAFQLKMPKGTQTGWGKYQSPRSNIPLGKVFKRHGAMPLQIPAQTVSFI